MAKRHANEFLRTSTGRLAGSGILHDNYSEDSILESNIRQGEPVYMEGHDRWYKSLFESPVTTKKMTKEELEMWEKNTFKEG